MIDLMMLAIAFQRLIAAKAVRVIDRAFARPLSNVLHQLSRADMLYDFGVNTPFPLQQPENKAFTCCATATLAFAATAKVCLVEFYFAAQFARLKLGRVIETFAQVLVHARDRLLIQLPVRGQAVSRHMLVEAFDDLQLTAKWYERFLPVTAPTFNVAASRTADLKRAAEDARSASAKVGRTTEMARSNCNHAYLAYAAGYFSP